jgi:competence protein ComEA
MRELARRAGVTGVPTPVLVVGFALLSVAVVAALLRWWPHPAEAGGVAVSRPASRVSVAPSASGATTSAGGGAAGAGTGAAGVDAAQGSGAATVCVHVVGAVRHPGVYTLAARSRVDAAVAVAGGLTPSAAPAAINLAAPLQDGQQVVVPTEEEVRAGSVPAAAGGGSAAGALGGGVAAAGAAGGPTGAGGAKVNLNTADATQLDTLPGVGPSTAAKIVADRVANGPYGSVGDLGRVAGIGPKKLEELGPLVCVR